MCGSRSENGSYKFVPTSPTVPSMSYSNGLSDGRLVAVQQSSTSSICSKQHAATLCSSHLAFFPGVS